MFFIYLEIEVLEGSLESTERVLREGQIGVVGQFERRQFESTEGVVRHLADAVARQIQEGKAGERAQRQNRHAR